MAITGREVDAVLRLSVGGARGFMGSDRKRERIQMVDPLEEVDRGRRNAVDDMLVVISREVENRGLGEGRVDFVIYT